MAKVAEESGVGVSALQNYESGLRLPDLATLERWAGALGMAVVFDLRQPSEDERAARVAATMREMDDRRARAAARLVELAASARPDQLLAALAAFEALTSASAQEAESPPRGPSTERP